MVLGAELMRCAAHVYMTPTRGALGANKSRNVPVWHVHCTQSDLLLLATRTEHDPTQGKKGNNDTFQPNPKNTDHTR